MILHLSGQILVDAETTRDECWVVDGKITFDRPSGDVTTIKGWVLPGLVDAHCHVGLDEHGPIDEATSEAQAVADRERGALLLRDAGSPSDTRWVQDRDDLPRLVRAGRHIARTRRYIRNYAHEIEPEDLATYMAQEARSGDGWVKIVGDWIDREKGDLGPCWPDESVQQGIAAAHTEGARVTAHCFDETSLAPLITAGIDCIEHATGLTDETIALASEHNVVIVPTLVNIATFPEIAASADPKFPVYAAHMRDLYNRRYDTIRAAHEAGVTVFCGTDAGGVIPHGLVAQEVAELTKAGLSNSEAIAAATWDARPWLGFPGIEEGAPADLVVYPANPIDDVTVMEHPTAVILRGVPYRP